MKLTRESQEQPSSTNTLDSESYPSPDGQSPVKAESEVHTSHQIHRHSMTIKRKPQGFAGKNYHYRIAASSTPTSAGHSPISACSSSIFPTSTELDPACSSTMSEVDEHKSILQKKKNADCAKRSRLKKRVVVQSLRDHVTELNEKCQKLEREAEFYKELYENECSLNSQRIQRQ